MEDDPVRASSARIQINDCGRCHTINRWHSYGQKASSMLLTHHIVGSGLGGFTHVPYLGGQHIIPQSVSILTGGIL
jgi:hypothetical protein